jgi:aryl-alcohol dehydrogenase-like predicted oxidoreductase
MGLGLAALGRPAYITVGRDVDLGPDRSVEAMQMRTHTLLDTAYALGVRYIDTARSYGRAEEFLSSWLDARHLRPDDITVGSKWGYTYTGEWAIDAAVHEVKDHSLSTLRTQVRRSLELLGDYLSVYQVHSATLESGVLDNHEVQTELVDLAERGLTVGLTVSGPNQSEVIRRALEVEIDGLNPFRCVQATWNLLEPSVAPALIDAHDFGWGVIIKEALANGRLTDGWPTSPDAPIRTLAEHWHVPVDQVALAAAIAQPWADVVLSGAVTTSQLRSNVGAVTLEVHAHDFDLLAAMAEQPNEYWRTRAGLSWS